MRINSTAEYLDCLDKIAQFIDKHKPSAKEISIMELMRIAVVEFEFNEIKKYPAKDFLVDNLFNNSFNKN